VAVTGRTRVVAVIGDPVEHSRSPQLHNAAFAAAGLDWVHVALPVPAGRGGDAVGSARVLGLAGLSVTMPHKAAVAAAADRLGATASRLGAANTVVFDPDGAAVADSTDGAGLIADLADAGWAPAGRACVVLGAGGAARAVTLALADNGAAQVTVVARRAGAAAACAELAGDAGAVGPPAAVAAAELIVDATSVGMRPGAGLPFGIDPELLAPGRLVVDLVYEPTVTPLIAAARSRGALGRNGLGMLVHQAALQWERWTGLPAPILAMRRAAEAPPPARAQDPPPSTDE
jgi:shikimate dehydrogenase